MKRLFNLLIIILFTSLVSGQSWIASTRIQSTKLIAEISSVIDDNGNVIIFGFFEGTVSASNGETIDSHGGRDYIVVKFQQNGEIDWMKQLGGTSHEYVTGGVDIDTEGNVYVTGGFQGYLRYSPSDSISSAGSYDVFLAKISSAGDIVWINNTGKGARLQYPTSLNIDDSGDIVMASSFQDSINILDTQTLFADNTSTDFCYGKYSSDGALIWIKHGRSLHDTSANIWKIESTLDGYYFVGIFTDSIGFESDTISSDKEALNSFLLKTNLAGTIEWSRRIEGDKKDYCYSVVKDDAGDIYIGGYYTSDTLFIESSDNQIVEVAEQGGSNDIYVVKYSPDGALDWHRTAGGKGSDKAFSMEFFNNYVYIAGTFSDTIFWGGIELTTNGVTDSDMITGALDKDGNFREANNFAGRNDSYEESRGIFQNGENLYTIMRSNSDLLVVGDSIYISDGTSFYIVLGIIGCNPISIDQVITQNVQTCNGDSTGAIQILASGGFGAPWQYSIDNGLTYQDAAYFGAIPAGDYPIVVIDAEHCAQPGTTETVTQPEPLSLELVSEEFTGDSMVNIVVAAYGGTPPYTYTLQPNGIVQAFGDFNVKWSEPGYYVVEVNDIRNCGPVVTDTLNTSSGIDLFAPGVKLYPNPTSGIITVEVPFQGSACTLEVLNLTGQVMLSRQVYSNGISINETIDLSDLSKGMYMIRVDGQTLKSGVVVN